LENGRYGEGAGGLGSGAPKLNGVLSETGLQLKANSDIRFRWPTGTESSSAC
jgi:hypothetical protein